MKKYSFCLLLAFTLFQPGGLAGANDKESKVVKYTYTLKVQDAKGRPKTLECDSSTIVTAMATWCPASKQTLELISDPDLSRALKGYRFVFVFSDEWPYIEKGLQTELHMSARAAKEKVAELKEKAGGGPLFDPTMLNLCKGDIVYATPELDKKIESVPTRYSPTTGKFEGHPLDFLKKALSR